MGDERKKRVKGSGEVLSLAMMTKSKDKETAGRSVGRKEFSLIQISEGVTLTLTGGVLSLGSHKELKYFQNV